jgi:hypothetical protein
VPASSVADLGGVFSLAAGERTAGASAGFLPTLVALTPLRETLPAVAASCRFGGGTRRIFRSAFIDPANSARWRLLVAGRAWVLVPQWSLASMEARRSGVRLAPTNRGSYEASEYTRGQPAAT